MRICWDIAVIGLLPGSLSDSHERLSQSSILPGFKGNTPLYLLLFHFLKAGCFNLGTTDILNKIILRCGAVGALYDA